MNPKTAKRLIAALCLSALLFALAGCGARPTDLFDEGAERFSAGKTEEDYAMLHSGDLLDELMEKYSGSLYVPDHEKLTDEQLKEFRIRRGELPTPTPTPVPPEPTPTPPPGHTPAPTPVPQEPTPEPTPVPVTLPEIGSDEELAALVCKAWKNVDEGVHFRMVRGYFPDIGKNINKLCNLIEDADPICGNGTSTWYSSSAGDEFYITFDYKWSAAELQRMRGEAQARAAAVAKQLNKPGMSEYEQIRAVNDYLCDTVLYPPNEPYAEVTHTAYGALINGVAVCEGYSCAAAAILREMGLECRIIWGPCTNGEGHAWNLVLVDGNWYQLDVTWNDCSGERELYLLVSDAFMRQSRSWDFSLFPATPSRAYR